MSYLFRSFTTFEVIDKDSGEVIYKEVSEPNEVGSLSELLGFSGVQLVESYLNENIEADDALVIDDSENAIDTVFSTDEDKVITDKDDIFADVSIQDLNISPEEEDHEILDDSELDDIEEFANSDEVISLPDNDSDNASEESHNGLDDIFNMDDLTMDLSEADDSTKDESLESIDDVSFKLDVEVEDEEETLSDSDTDDIEDDNIKDSEDDDQDDIISRRSNVDSLF